MVKLPALKVRKVSIVNDEWRRRSIRWPNYDYAQAGAYFVTICTHNRQLFFEDATIRAIAERCWLAIPKHFSLVTMDDWVVMPTHVHGIIVIADEYEDARRDSDGESNVSHRRGVPLNAPTANNNDVAVNQRTGDDIVDSCGDNGESNVSHCRDVQLNVPTRDPANRYSLISPQRNTLAVIVRTYNAAVTTLCRRAGYPNFRWQGSYYERVIRDDAELNHTRQYIIDNSTSWNQDEHLVR